nr:hypothetical protein [Tanacetum cinerariifolium]
MENHVDALMKDAIYIMERSEDVCGITSDMMRQLPPEPSHQEAFEDLVMNFIHDQEEKVKQLEEYTCVIGSDFMQLSSKVIERLKEEIRIKENGVKKIEKITRCPDTEDLEPLNGHASSEALIKKVYTPPMTYSEEVEETLGTPMEVEPLDETPLEVLGLNTCNLDIPIFSREVPSSDETKPQPQTLPNCPPLYISLGDKRGLKPPIKPYSPDSFRIKAIDYLTIHTPPSPHMASFYPKKVYCYYHPCIDDPQIHNRFKTDENPIRTRVDYSKPSHEGYRNTIKLPEGNNVVPLSSDTIRLVKNGCSFHGLRSEDPIQHLKDFLRIVDSIDLNDPSRLGMISPLVSSHNFSHWEKLLNFKNDILRFQQRQDKSLYDTPEEAWETIEELARYENEGWNDPIFPEERSLDNKNPDIEQLLGIMENRVDALMKDAISIMGRSKDVCGMTSDMMRQLPPELSHQEAFKDLVLNFIHDQEEKVKQLEEYMCVIRSDFMKVPSSDEMKPQPQTLPNCPPLYISLGDKRGLKPPIKPHSLDTFRMKAVDYLTIHTLSSPHMASFYHKKVYCYYHPCIDDPQIHNGFKLGAREELRSSSRSEVM